MRYGNLGKTSHENEMEVLKERFSQYMKQIGELHPTEYQNFKALISPALEGVNEGLEVAIKALEQAKKKSTQYDYNSREWKEADEAAINAGNTKVELETEKKYLEIVLAEIDRRLNLQQKSKEPKQKDDLRVLLGRKTVAEKQETANLSTTAIPPMAVPPTQPSVSSGIPKSDQQSLGGGWTKGVRSSTQPGPKPPGPPEVKGSTLQTSSPTPSQTSDVKTDKDRLAPPLQGTVAKQGRSGSAPATTVARPTPHVISVPPPIIQTALSAISPVIKSFEEKSIDAEKAAQQLALAIFQADRDMHVILKREKEKRFGMRGSQIKMEKNHLTVNRDGILISDKEEYADCRKIREELKFFSEDATKIVATGTNFISKAITQSLSDVDPKLKEKKLEMWLKVLEILDINHDYEGIASLYYGIVGAFPVKTLPGEGESIYMLQRESDTAFINDKMFNKLMEYRKLIERGPTKDYFLPAVLDNIRAGEQVIPSFHTFNVPSLYGNEQFNRSIKLIAPIEVKETDAEADIKKRQEDVQSRKNTIQRLGKDQIIKTVYEAKDAALNLIMSMELTETRLPDEIVLRKASLLSQAQIKPLQPPPPEKFDEELNVTASSNVRKGTRELPLVNPLAGFDNKINKTIEIQKQLEAQVKRLEDEKKDSTEIKKQLFEVNYGLLNLEKERLKLLEKGDFDNISKSLGNQQKYLNNTRELAKELILVDKKNTTIWNDKTQKIDSELRVIKEQSIIILDSRAAKNYKDSLQHKSPGELDFENIELNKKGNILLNNFSLPRTVESHLNYLTQLSNQLTRISDYESYMKTNSKNLSTELKITKDNLQYAINIIRLNEDFQKLIERQKGLPPLPTAEYNNRMEEIHNRAQAIHKNMNAEENIQNIAKKPMADVAALLNNINKESKPNAPTLEQSTKPSSSWVPGKKQT